MKNDYGGHANQLSRTSRASRCASRRQASADALDSFPGLGFDVVVVKNKYKFPTPMGYSDFNLVVAVPLADGTKYLYEMQLNLVAMLDAKHEAHAHYEVIRKRLPELCKGTPVKADELESFISGRLNNSALDSAVAALSLRADGLFLYAHLLAEHLERAGGEIDFGSLDALPAGLGEVYATNSARLPGRRRRRRLGGSAAAVELVAAAPEPLKVETAKAMLGMGSDSRVLELTSLFLPVRDGLIHVLHKAVRRGRGGDCRRGCWRLSLCSQLFDWLTGEIDEASGVKERSEEFRVERVAGHACAARACAGALARELDEMAGAASDAAAAAALGSGSRRRSAAQQQRCSQASTTSGARGAPRPRPRCCARRRTCGGASTPTSRASSSRTRPGGGREPHAVLGARLRRRRRRAVASAHGRHVPPRAARGTRGSSRSCLWKATRRRASPRLACAPSWRRAGASTWARRARPRRCRSAEPAEDERAGARAHAAPTHGACRRSRATTRATARRRAERRGRQEVRVWVAPRAARRCWCSSTRRGGRRPWRGRGGRRIVRRAARRT